MSVWAMSDLSYYHHRMRQAERQAAKAANDAEQWRKLYEKELTRHQAERALDALRARLAGAS